MQVVSSSDVRYMEKLDSAKKFFGEKNLVTRQEILSFQETTGTSMPAKFWTLARVGRGMFSLDSQQQEAHPAAEIIPIKQEVVAPVIKNDVKTTISKFDRESLIPQSKETFVEWGNYKTVETLLKSNEFFTLYVTGDSGSGKNEMVAQACAKLNRPLVRVSMNRETKEEHLVGSKTLIDGSIVYEEGPVVWCAKNGAVLLLDEISTVDANEAFCLQSILEGGEFFVKSANEVVRPAPGFCVIATDNTKGRGSDSGRYIGTNILNDAFLERFEMTMEQGYPNEKTERKIIEKLMQSIGLDDQPFADRLVTWVQAIRKTFMEEAIEEQITTRRACHIIKTYKKLKKADLAIELCVSRFDETTKMAMISLWDKLTPVAADSSDVESD